MIKRRTLLEAGFASMAGAALFRAVPAIAQNAINVTVEPATLARVEYARGRPPPDMPKVGDGSGLCNNGFEIEAGVGSSVEVLSPTSVRLFPEEFNIVTRLAVTIYTVKGSPPKLHAHEEGHRAIGAHYYQNAQAAATEAAMSVIGRSFDGSGANRAAAEQAANDIILATLADAYMARTQERSVAANGRYDAITDHGLKPIAEAEAIAMALAQDP